MKTILLLMSLLLFPACDQQKTPKPRVSKYKIEKPTNGKFHPIIKLGKHGCSAFVVSDYAAITAGHCLDATEMFIKKELPGHMKESIKFIRQAKEEIELIRNGHCFHPPAFCEQRVLFLEDQIRKELKAREIASKLHEFDVHDVYGKNTKIRAVAYSKQDDKNRDYGYVRGDFRKFNKLKIKRDHGVNIGDTLRICGFPNTKAPAVCVDYLSAGSLHFEMIGHSMVVPGMSGGPAINSNGEVVGIIVGTRKHYTRLTPMLGIDSK